jgi:undecaprenyl diphosphate synthase
LVIIENCCDWAIDKGIKFLTFYCFSTENWKRSSEEISFLMDLGRDYFKEQKQWYVKRGIKV